MCEVINKTENEFKIEFIYEKDDRDIRQQRWIGYCDFISLIKKYTFINKFDILIFGSILTDKINPKDIDVILIFNESQNEKINITSSGLDMFIKNNSRDIYSIHCDNIHFENLVNYDTLLNTLTNSLLRNSKFAIRINY